jgi:hypothetical protein
MYVNYRDSLGLPVLIYFPYESYENQGKSLSIVFASINKEPTQVLMTYRTCVGPSVVFVAGTTLSMIASCIAGHPFSLVQKSQRHRLY